MESPDLEMEADLKSRVDGTKWRNDVPISVGGSARVVNFLKFRSSISRNQDGYEIRGLRHNGTKFTQNYGPTSDLHFYVEDGGRPDLDSSGVKYCGKYGLTTTCTF